MASERVGMGLAPVQHQTTSLTSTQTSRGVDAAKADNLPTPSSGDAVVVVTNVDSIHDSIHDEVTGVGCDRRSNRNYSASNASLPNFTGMSHETLLGGLSSAESAGSHSGKPTSDVVLGNSSSHTFPTSVETLGELEKDSHDYKRSSISRLLDQCEAVGFPFKKKLLLNKLGLTATDVPLTDLCGTRLGNSLYKISLAGNHLRTVPALLVQSLPALKHLDLSNCELHELPKEWNLPNLTHLNLSHNQLAYFPEEGMLEGLHDLIELNMYGNKVREIIVPGNVRLLSKLETLNLGYNENLDQIASLRTLIVMNNFLDKIPRRVCDMDLRYIDVSSNPVTQPPREICEGGIVSMKQYYHLERQRQSFGSPPKAIEPSAEPTLRTTEDGQSIAVTGSLKPNMTPPSKVDIVVTRVDNLRDLSYQKATVSDTLKNGLRVFSTFVAPPEDNLQKPPADSGGTAMVPSLKAKFPDIVRAVVLVGLWDGESQTVARAGSGFIVDAKRGLIVTAGHTLLDLVDDTQYPSGVKYGSARPGKIIIGIIPNGTDTDGPNSSNEAVFRYFAVIVSKDPSLVDGKCHLDACVLRITTRMTNDVGGDGRGCGEQLETLLNNRRAFQNENLVSLELTEECELEEKVRILGYNQGEDGLLAPRESLNRCVDIGGEVCTKLMHGMSDTGGAGSSDSTRRFMPLKEIVVKCYTIGGHSGGPCVNEQGQVMGILCRADPDDKRRCYISPTSEWKGLVRDAQKMCGK